VALQIDPVMQGKADSIQGPDDLEDEQFTQGERQKDSDALFNFTKLMKRNLDCSIDILSNRL